MNIVSARRVRQVVQKQGTALQEQIIPAVQGLAQNDKLTRQRLDSHEQRLDMGEAFEMRTFWQRWRWLVTGR